MERRIQVNKTDIDFYIFYNVFGFFRKLLKEIMSAKKKCLLFEGKQKDNLEELMVAFMRHSILPIWPEGWMYLNNLKKVYNSMTEMSKIATNVKSEHETSNSVPRNIDKSNMDASNIDKANVENSLNTITPKHSNLTITPVEVKTSTVKPDLSNSVTVTKIMDDVSSNNGNKITETTMASTHLLKKMFDDIGKTKVEEPRITSHERPKPEKDYSRTKIINLDSPGAKSSSTSRHVQESTYKSTVERSVTSEQKTNWPNDVSFFFDI